MHTAEGFARGIKTGWKGVLSALESGLKGIQKKYDAAKSKLSSVKSSWSQQYTAVRDAFRGQGITERGNDVGQIIGSLTTQANANKRMLSLLKKLEKSGLNQTTLRQLAEAGPDALGQAESIYASGGSGISQINRLQRSINKTSKSAGKFLANDIYGKALNAQTKVTQHLSKEIKELTRAIKYAQKQSKRKVKRNALGTTSFTGGLSWVGEDGPEIMDVPGGTRILSNSQSRQAMAPIIRTGSRPQRVVLELRGTDRVLLDMIRKAVRSSGGNVQVVLGA